MKKTVSTGAAGFAALTLLGAPAAHAPGQTARRNEKTSRAPWSSSWTLRRPQNGRQLPRIREVAPVRRPDFSPRHQGLHDSGRWSRRRPSESHRAPIRTRRKWPQGRAEERPGHHRHGTQGDRIRHRAVLHQSRQQRPSNFPSRDGWGYVAFGRPSSAAWTYSTRSPSCSTSPKGMHQNVPQTTVTIEKSYAARKEIGSMAHVKFTTNHGEFTSTSTGERPQHSSQLPAVRPRRPLRQHHFSPRDRRFHDRAAAGTGHEAKAGRAPIEHEGQVTSMAGLKNSKYTVAMARTNDPHSGSSQFFINVADNAFP